jgi:hypothetical protein
MDGGAIGRAAGAQLSGGTGMKLGMNYPHYDSGQLWVGVFFPAFAIADAILFLPRATKSSSAVLYILIFCLREFR